MADKTMVDNDEILFIINNSERKFVVDFGIMQGEEFGYFIKAKTSSGIELLRYVGGIILKFCEDKKVEVLSYIPNSNENDKLFNLMIKNSMFNDYYRYRKKELQPYTVFLVSNKIMKKNEEEKS